MKILIMKNIITLAIVYDTEKVDIGYFEIHRKLKEVVDSHIFERNKDKLPVFYEISVLSHQVKEMIEEIENENNS